MALMAAGLAFTTGPATEAIMGALPPGKAGAGSAVNDTTREVGGTLGVAIVGSVLNSAYGSHVLGGLVRLGASASAGRAAGQSVIAGVTVAAHFPAPLRAAARQVVSSAFMTGLHRGSLVAAGAVAAAGLLALFFVPAQARSGWPRPSDRNGPGRLRPPRYSHQGLAPAPLAVIFSRRRTRAHGCGIHVVIAT